MRTGRMKHYLYQHIRLDTGTVFYIGIGSKRSRNFVTHRGEYERAYSKYDRNYWWKRIVNEHGYRVEIILESNDYSFIMEQEEEFISYFGRADLNEGLLVNRTDGGEAMLSIRKPPSEETKRKLSEAKRGSKHREETKKRISKTLKGRKPPAKTIKRSVEVRSRRVIQMDKEGNYIREFLNAHRAAEELGLYQQNIHKVCKGKRETTGGYRWKYALGKEQKQR